MYDVRSDRVRQTLTLAVPKATGTPGRYAGCLGLWRSSSGRGWAIARVILSIDGEYYRIETDVPMSNFSSRLAGFSWQRLVGKSACGGWQVSRKGRTPKTKSAIRLGGP